MEMLFAVVAAMLLGIASLDVALVPIFAVLSFSTTALSPSIQKKQIEQNYYDLVVIGGGASGMFAAGTAASLGCKTLLIEKKRKDEYQPQNSTTSSLLLVGGDCTNYACVPSKAIRAVAKLSSLQQQRQNQKQHAYAVEASFSFLDFARQHSTNVVSKVRQRESIDRLATSSPNLDLVFANKTSFVSSTELCLQDVSIPYGKDNPITSSPKGSDTTKYNDNNEVVNDDDGQPTAYIDYKNKDNITLVEIDHWNVTCKQVIVATGSDPVVPHHLKDSANIADVPFFTYRTLFSPEGILADKVFWRSSNTKERFQNVVIAGGGPTACEIGQSLARLITGQNKNPTNITMVAPDFLKDEDVSARNIARRILKNDGVNLLRGKVVDIGKDKQTVISLNNKTYTIPCDILILALGRKPGTSLHELDLEKAGVQWSWDEGVFVDHQLRSTSSKNIFASGDCASIALQRDRRASHAGWTGYHAVQSALLPKLLRPKLSIHKYVPRVTFLDPEIASIGLTRDECVERYGHDGFKYLKISEEGSDRSDMDAPLERTVPGFIELRIIPPSGRIVGATICSSVASELINEIGLVLRKGLSCRDIARSLHSYPSRGYFLYRVSLALALSDAWGLFAATNFIGRTIGFVGETIIARPIALWKKIRKTKTKRLWEAEGQRKELQFQLDGDDEEYKNLLGGGSSWLEGSFNEDFCMRCIGQVSEGSTSNTNDCSDENDTLLKGFVEWLNRRPKR